MTTNNPPAIAIKFAVAADHGDWLETVRRAAAPADLDLLELCADRGSHLHPPSLLVHMWELLHYTPEELDDTARWIRAMTLVGKRVHHPATEAFAEFVHSVDAHMVAVAPPHDHGPYVEVVDRDNGEAWACPSFTFHDALYWATGSTQITATAFAHDFSSPFAQLTVTGPDLADVNELHVANDAVRDALARHHYEHVISGTDDVLRHLNTSTDAHCRELLAGTETHHRHDIWDLEKILIRD